jgi:predicted transcriptional regulator of viral defense system
MLVDSGIPLRARDFAAYGINRMALHRLVANSVIERAGNGIYRLPNKVGMFDDWAVIASRYPEAVIATLSAAVFHRTTQEMPGSLHVAFPRNSGRSSLPDSFPVMTKVLRWSATADHDPFAKGVSLHEIDSVQVKITDPERTLVDMFRYSPFNSSVRDTAIHVSEEAVLDCLQRTVAREDFSIDALFERADAARVLRQMSPLIKNAMYSLAQQPESLSI